MKDNSKLKVGLIGCGNMGRTHSEVLKRLSEAENLQVTALGDSAHENLTRAGSFWPDAKRYQDCSRLIQEEAIDILHICLPSFLHGAFAKEAMEKGIHVFVEKPVSLTREEASEMLRIQGETGSKVMVGHVVRYMPEYQYLKKVTEEKKYGQLKSVNLTRLTRSQPEWFYDTKKSGSVILDLQIHDIDFLYYILGKPQERASCIKMIGQPGPNHAVSVYEYEGCLAKLEALWDISERVPFHVSFRAQFEKATIVYDNLAGHKVSVYHISGDNEHPDMEENKGDDLAPYEEEIRHFIHYVRGHKNTSITTLKDAAESLQYALECIEGK